MSIHHWMYEKLVANASPYRTLTIIDLLFISGISIVFISSLLISIIKYKKEKLDLDLRLCILLLIFDLCSSVVFIINGIAAALNYSSYINTRAMCDLVGVLTLLPFIVSVNLMAVISLQRCLVIVYNKEYSHRFYYIILIVMVLMSIINSLQTSIFNGFAVFPNAIYCSLDPSTASGLAGSLLLSTICGLEYGTIVFCYISICIYRRKHSQKAQIELGLDPVKVKKSVNSTIIKSLSIIATSLFTSGVYVLTIVVSCIYPDFITNFTELLQIFFLSPQMILNTIILLVMKPALWDGMKKLYGFSPKVKVCNDLN
ncbi:hypothetical protein CONCODRAFT_7706 [Conidiobolus coronatus NRRL 28638]|uniref:G-protein coupled receptors family 1 profile domain-containing protein n=1 Tax=Conidiobolus coronatus (strain ATCC 28846 / CBS 209.66 / NRRL 28638) TaxID=796925 RepID=A0A137P476_CONC2|nr:hypothetical protein CONCODRAFT_7706 [Conidiobolus coronatus NRRL 28638]|eukprot:KXN69815.1 hypothetical protein CONCODRAFT_7706 [Conidiobolus coronatus NRRL 28638]